LRRAQQAKMPTIGVLGTASAAAWSAWTAALVLQLRELGWIDGRTVAIEYRWADERNERFAEIAAEFVQLKADVILTSGGAGFAAKQAISTIPIVIVLQDPAEISDVTPRWPMLDPRCFGSLRCTHRGLTRVHAQTRAANQMQILTPKPASHRTMLPVKTGPRRTRYPKAYVITGTASKAMIAHLL
jgi:hypothetical protein